MAEGIGFAIPINEARRAAEELRAEGSVKRGYLGIRMNSTGITDKAKRALMAQRWPGNVRELQNVLERGVILAPQNGWIEEEHLFASNLPAAPQSGVGEDGRLEEPAAHHPATDAGGLQDAVLDAGVGLDDFEQALLRRAVERANGNLAAAARLLGITRPQLNYRLKKQDAER
jgi:transcriptional regulator with PAS, ATPase and Fis domain